MKNKLKHSLLFILSIGIFLFFLYLLSIPPTPAIDWTNLNRPDDTIIDLSLIRQLQKAQEIKFEDIVLLFLIILTGSIIIFIVLELIHFLLKKIKKQHSEYRASIKQQNT
jgi:hypothetical protein